MCPDATLARLREALIPVYRGDTAHVDFGEVAELFVALDDWLAKGGFLPAAWSGERTIP